MNTSKNLDLILDRFSKAHPFADTRAYNLFHEQAKAAIVEAVEGFLNNIAIANAFTDGEDHNKIAEALLEQRKAIKEWQ